MSATGNGYEKIQYIIYNVECDIQELSEKDKCELGELTFELDTDYRCYGSEIVGYNILKLNFPGCSDWYYFIAIPENEMAACKQVLDTYPIYFADFESAKLERCFDNYKAFLHFWLPDEKKLDILSNRSRRQKMPVLRQLNDEVHRQLLEECRAAYHDAERNSTLKPVFETLDSSHFDGSASAPFN